MSWGPLPGRSPGEPRRLSEGLDAVVRALGAPSASGLASLFDSWPELVGEVIAHHVTPLRIDRGTLVVAVDDPMWITELRWHEADLLKRFDEALGKGVVEAILARVRPG